MNILNVIFRKKRKKVIEKPEYVNLISTFNHKNIVQSEELLGCNDSQSLFLDAEIDLDKVGFVFIGKTGMNVYEGLKKRQNEIKHFIRIWKENDHQSSSSEKNDLFIIPEDNKRLSFANGLLWAQSNKQRIEDYVKKKFSNCSIIYIFTDTNGFSMMISKEFASKIKENNQLPLLLVPIPDFSSAEPKALLDFCAFYYYLLSLENPETFPFILLDENEIRNNNTNKLDLETLKNYYIRVGYTILDLFALFSMNSKLYNIDTETIISMLQNHKGPYRLLYFDIYDNKPAISCVFDMLDDESREIYVSKVVTGFIGIQPSSERLSVEEYKNIRSLYANKDVFISIVKERAKGAIIRGIVLNEEISKRLLEQMTSLFNSISIQVLDETGTETEQKIITSTKDLEDVFNYKYYSVVQSILEQT